MGQSCGIKAKRRGCGGKHAILSVDLEILGASEARRRMKKLRIGAARNVVNKSLRQAAKRIMKPAIDANISTVSPGQFGTGRLKQLKTRIRRYGKIGIRIQTPTREKLGIKPDEAYYPAILEVGLAEKGIEPKRMLRRARDQKSASVKTFLRRVMGKFIDAEVKKLAAKGKPAFR